MLYKVFNENGDAVWINAAHIIEIAKSKSKPGFYNIRIDRKSYDNPKRYAIIKARPGCDELRMLLDVDEE